MHRTNILTSSNIHIVTYFDMGNSSSTKSHKEIRSSLVKGNKSKLEKLIKVGNSQQIAECMTDADADGTTLLHIAGKFRLRRGAIYVSHTFIHYSW